jgi:hypothetical protein
VIEFKLVDDIRSCLWRLCWARSIQNEALCALRFAVLLWLLCRFLGSLDWVRTGGGGINCAQLDSAAKLGFMDTEECTFIRSFLVKETCCGAATGTVTTPATSPTGAAQGMGDERWAKTTEPGSLRGQVTTTNMM